MADGPFIKAGNQLASAASRTAGIRARAIKGADDVAQLVDILKGIYSGTNGGVDLMMQGDAIVGAFREVVTALERLESDIRAAAAAAGQLRSDDGS